MVLSTTLKNLGQNICEKEKIMLDKSFERC